MWPQFLTNLANFIKELNIFASQKTMEPTKPENVSVVSPEKIYQTAISFLGQDASPNDLAPDEFGCAETVSNILIKAGCNLDVTLSTAELYKLLKNSKKWVEVKYPYRGDVVISPTGQGGQNGVTHGHTGIVGDNGKIMSNDSSTGQFKANYTIDSWLSRYKVKGGYPVVFFKRVIIT